MANKTACERTCISCRSGADKSLLLRIAKSSDEQISVDKTGKSGGRGAYVCKNTACVLKAQKERRIERALKTKIEPEIYETLLKLSESNE